jgi:hypothetical protein
MPLNAGFVWPLQIHKKSMDYSVVILYKDRIIISGDRDVFQRRD